MLNNTHICTFGERLEKLMVDDGINIDKKKGADTELAAKMLKSGCLNFYVNEYQKSLNSARTQIGRHRKVDSASNLDGKWLKAYCDYFGCSADYLFGYISLPTHTASDIQKQTGLSSDAIKNIATEQNLFLDCLLTSSVFFEIDDLFNQLPRVHSISLSNAKACSKLQFKYTLTTDFQEKEEIDKLFRNSEDIITNCGERWNSLCYRIGISFGNFLENLTKEKFDEIRSAYFFKITKNDKEIAHENI